MSEPRRQQGDPQKPGTPEKAPTEPTPERAPTEPVRPESLPQPRQEGAPHERSAPQRQHGHEGGPREPSAPQGQAQQEGGPREPSAPQGQGQARQEGGSRPQGVKLGVFVGGLAIALIAGFGLGKLIKPASPTANAQTGAPAPQASASGGHVHTTAGGASAGSEVGGLAISSGGYTLTPLAHDAGKLSFVIKGSDGKPVTDFAIVHEKQLHLILVRRDFTGYQHLHPTMAPDGTWSVAANLATPGPWRAYADFTAIAAGGAQNAITLGYDITVPGDYQPQAVPAAARESTVDGLTVTYEGTPVVGATSPMLFRATGTLEPYLGSFGHLVVLREGDLGYVHVHPEPQLSGGAVKFWLAAPSPGRYRMYFDYQIGGKVRTSEFTLVVA